MTNANYINILDNSRIQCLIHRFNIINITPNFARVLGYSKSELINKPYLDLLSNPADMLAKTPHLLAEVMWSGSTEFELHAVTKEKEEIITLARVSEEGGYYKFDFPFAEYTDNLIADSYSKYTA